MTADNLVLLDTHAWLWHASGDTSLGPKARTAIDRAAASSRVCVSVASCWEVGQLVAKKKISLKLPTRSWMHRSIASMGLRVIELRRRQVMDAVDMIGKIASHDPFDSFIFATAARCGARLVSADGHLKDHAEATGTVVVLDARR